jgi:hypothetical protein
MTGFDGATVRLCAAASFAVAQNRATTDTSIRSIVFRLISSLFSELGNYLACRASEA